MQKACVHNISRPRMLRNPNSHWVVCILFISLKWVWMGGGGRRYWLRHARVPEPETFGVRLLSSWAFYHEPLGSQLFIARYLSPYQKCLSPTQEHWPLFLLLCLYPFFLCVWASGSNHCPPFLYRKHKVWLILLLVAISQIS